jgi:hypothetical protein
MRAGAALGLGEGGAVALGIVLQIVAFILVLVVLVRIYGNAYAKATPTI